MSLVVLSWIFLIPLFGMAAYSVFKTKMLMFERMIGRYNAVPFEEEDFNVEDDNRLNTR